MPGRNSGDRIIERDLTFEMPIPRLPRWFLRFPSRVLQKGRSGTATILIAAFSPADKCPRSSSPILALTPNSSDREFPPRPCRAAPNRPTETTAGSSRRTEIAGCVLPQGDIPVAVRPQSHGFDILARRHCLRFRLAASASWIAIDASPVALRLAMLCCSCVR